MPEPPSFRELQYRFAAHLRDPEHHAAPVDVEDRRMAIYRDLFFSNIKGFIDSGFPVLRKLYTDRDWSAMARDFYARHQSHTPLFAEIAQEFLKYLQDERIPQPEDPPFLLELAHYEWVELALSISEETPDLDRIDVSGNLLEGIPALSPLAWLLSYSYPVHRIGPEFRPGAPDPQPTYVVVYRNLADEVKFMLVNPVTARLIALMQERPEANGRVLLEQIAQELGHPDSNVVMQGGAQTFTQLHKADIVLGTKIS